MSVLLQAEGLMVAHGVRRVLDGVDLTLHRAEIVGVLGPNGSGKSTLLRVLLGAQQPDQGIVRLEGVPLRTLSATARARSLTMVAQPRTPDFALTVRDVVGLGRIPHEPPFGSPGPRDACAIADALEQTATAELADRDLATLSSGELQRVHLARAFAQEAKVLLLDEPTANLDLHHQLAAMHLLRCFAEKGGAAVVVGCTISRWRRARAVASSCWTRGGCGQAAHLIVCSTSHCSAASSRCAPASSGTASEA